MMTRFARKRDDDLSTPRRGRRFGIHYDPDQFGQFSETIARFLGTARFLVMQTAIVVMWMGINLAWGLNIGNIRDGGWDPCPASRCGRSGWRCSPSWRCGGGPSSRAGRT